MKYHEECVTMIYNFFFNYYYFLKGQTENENVDIPLGEKEQTGSGVTGLVQPSLNHVLHRYRSISSNVAFQSQAHYQDFNIKCEQL